MKDQRIQKPVYSSILLVIGLLLLIVAGLGALMYPSKTEIMTGILTSGGVCILLSFLFAPRLLINILTSRKSWLWINDIVLISAIIGIAVMLTYVGSRRHVRYDFTRDRLYSISDQTLKILKDLKKDVKITAFFPMGSLENGMVQDLLNEYKRINSERISFKMIDPYKDPVTVKAMNIRTPGTIVVLCGESRKDIGDNDIFQRPNPMMRQQQEQPKFTGEQAISSALITVTQGVKRKIHFVTGHDEPSITVYNPQGLAGLQEALMKENFEVSEGSLMEQLSTDTAVLVIMSPKKAFHPNEIQALKSFVLDRKGKLLVALDPDNACPELEKFLTGTFGVLANAEIIINPKGVNNNPTMVVPQYEMHPIVKAQMETKSGVLMQLCRGLSMENVPDWKSMAFLKANEQCYGKRQIEAVYQGQLEFNNGTDVHGPLNLGVALEGQNNASGSRIVVFGDADFATNMLLRVQGNTDLIVNTMNWLVGQEQMISIRPKTLEFGQINLEKLDREAVNRLLIILVVVSPLLVALVGGMVWFIRRRV